MNDTGDFQVKDTAAETLWQSFNDPRDTLLPGQKLEKGGSFLCSRLRETNFSTGKFRFRLASDGDGQLVVINLPTTAPYDAYHWTRTNDVNASNAGMRVEFNESGYLYILRANGVRFVMTSGIVRATGFYHRVTMNFDGVLVQYSHPKNFTGDANWSIITSIPDNICMLISERGTGPCGFNGVCKLDADQRANCSCPPNFSLLDLNDKYGGCKPDFNTQFCEADAPISREEIDFIELVNIEWLTSDYEMYNPYSVEECQESCRQDCFCDIIGFRDSSCWKKKLPLSNGRQDDSVNMRIFIKVRKNNSTMTCNNSGRGFSGSFEKNNQNGLVLVVSLLLGGSAFINLVFFGLVSFGSLVLYRKKFIPVATSQFCKSNLLHFSYMELVEATNDFKEELGRGSFGIVYKGLTQVAIAVKKLDRIVADSEKEFRTEVEVIDQTHHKNLVKLVGFCDEGQHRLLVYEFLTNGTLSDLLFGDIKLCWEQRTRVALGIAKGLMYLHEDCATQIIHCDIKPQNILLDDNLDAKIADFGLAKLLMLDHSRTFTAIRGTKGYVAPEWFRNSPVTPKVDVYSFGVVLLEIICCRRNVDAELSEDEAILIDWAYDCYVEGKVDVLVANDEEAMVDLNKVERFLMVAIWCIQEDPNLRPTMKMVLLMLEGIIHVAVPPCPSPLQY